MFGALMDAEHATPLLLRDGKLDKPVSLGHFLEDVPFYCVYDDITCERPIEPEEKALHDPPEAAPASSSIWNSLF